MSAANLSQEVIVTISQVVELAWSQWEMCQPRHERSVNRIPQVVTRSLELTPPLTSVGRDLLPGKKLAVLYYTRLRSVSHCAQIKYQGFVRFCLFLAREVFIQFPN